MDFSKSHDRILHPDPDLEDSIAQVRTAMEYLEHVLVSDSDRISIFMDHLSCESSLVQVQAFDVDDFLAI